MPFEIDIRTLFWTVISVVIANSSSCRMLAYLISQMIRIRSVGPVDQWLVGWLAQPPCTVYAKRYIAYAFRTMLSRQCPSLPPPKRNCFFNVSETTGVSKFKFYHHLAIDSHDSWSGNNITRYFRSVESTQTRPFCVIFGPRFIDNYSTNLENIFANSDPGVSLAVVKTL